MPQRIKAPFPYFGGKSRVAAEIWNRLGNVDLYIEPFAGSLAVLLARPSVSNLETVNDLDCNVVNFWRALKFAPEQLARMTEWPVMEVDLIARNNTMRLDLGLKNKLVNDPRFFDLELAAWWVHGLCGWIGSGFCAGKANAKLPRIRPGGIHTVRPGRKSTCGFTSVLSWFEALAERLRYTTVACGDWGRVLSSAATIGVITSKSGKIGVLLDPPYASARSSVYKEDSFSVAHDVRNWALEHGDDPRFRIALCGYHGEHEMPGWSVYRWEAQGGYANKKQDGRGMKNAKMETIWFSPHCLAGVG